MQSGKRLEYYIEKLGFNKKEFCDKFGFSYNSFIQILNGKRPIGVNVLDQIHVALPKLNVHWVLYGEGPEELDGQIMSAHEPSQIYVKENDAFEYMLLKYLENPALKNKIYEITKERAK